MLQVSTVELIFIFNWTISTLAFNRNERVREAGSKLSDETYLSPMCAHALSLSPCLLLSPLLSLCCFAAVGLHIGSEPNPVLASPHYHTKFMFGGRDGIAKKSKFSQKISFPKVLKK